jgi:predicted nucleic acid-binding protein
MVLIADTSALISLAIVRKSDLVQLLFQEYYVRIPSSVVSELNETSTYDDRHAEAARRVLDRIDNEHIRQAPERSDYPLDEGETAAIDLANELEADVFLCDECRELSTVHALLSGPRLMTSPKIIETFVLRETLSSTEAQAALSVMVAERSWRNNSYVKQFMDRFDTE